MDLKSRNLTTIIKYFYIDDFSTLTNRQTDKILLEYMIIDLMNLHKKYQASIVEKTREIHVSIFLYL